jgi:hypothetical protein
MLYNCADESFEGKWSFPFRNQCAAAKLKEISHTLNGLLKAKQQKELINYSNFAELN